MTSDIRLAVSIRSHRKVKKLRRKLGAEGVLSLVYLWIGTATSKPDGILIGWDVEDIALESEWEGEPQEFVDSLINLGFLDDDGNGTYRLHNWNIHQAWVVGAKARSEKAKNAIRARWDKKAEKENSRVRNQLQYSENTTSIQDVIPNKKGSNTPFLSSPLPTDQRQL
ncbi:hypothetical protein [Desulfosediminicola flagellatus]|uniref:hypothetical protein n=1 Tax=Desulfosediminicola flagellatus TaxID=2569541 RepID=UPI0010AD2B7E|nr:hypothetical protein [Desulfosediminicola flagellatus]